MVFELAERIKKLPPYLFKEIDRLKAEVQKQGKDVINLGVGDPDLATPPHIVERLKVAAEDPANHQYPSYSGMNDFRESVAGWYRSRFGVNLEPATEVVTLIGSKEGIAHLPLAFLNPGDIALVPSPAYPVYHAGTLFAGGESYFMPLYRENGFLPDLDAIPADVAEKAKMMFLNYPNNPTSAVAELDFFDRVVEFARRYNIIVCHDAAYTELAFDGYRPVSFMQAEGATEVGIEINSLSKPFSMTGWRIGMAVGNAGVLDGLGSVKGNVDSGAFNAVQFAAMTALDSDQECVLENSRIYQERRDVLVEGLRAAGLDAIMPKATFYVWCPVPKGYTSADFTAKLLKDAAIVTTPGSGFGEPGEGYVRMALTVSKERMAEVIERIRGLDL